LSLAFSFTSGGEIGAISIMNANACNPKSGGEPDGAPPAKRLRFDRSTARTSV
jgi:hypothetical protein